MFGSRFVKRRRRDRLSASQALLNRLANLFLRLLFRVPLNDFTNAFKAYRRTVIEGCRPFPLAAFQPDRRAAAEGDRSRLLLDGDADHLAQPPHRRGQAQDQGNGQPLPLHRPVVLAGEVLQPRRLP